MKKFGQLGGDYYLYRSVVSILSGLLLVAFHDKLLIYVVYAIGALILFFGIATTITLLNTKQEQRKNLMVGNAIINLVLGTFLLAAPTLFISIVATIVGLFLMFAGIFQLYLVAMRQKIERNASPALVILPILILISGCLIVFEPFALTANLLMFIGILIMFYGIVELLVRIRGKALGK